MTTRPAPSHDPAAETAAHRGLTQVRTDPTTRKLNKPPERGRHPHLVQGDCRRARAQPAARPYKLNEPRRHRIPSATHRVTNWPHYDRGLVDRGDARFWIADDAPASQFGRKLFRLVLGFAVPRPRRL